VEIGSGTPAEQKIKLLIIRIGDRGPAGGFIFYDKGSYSDGWRYMEAAPSDQSDKVQWYNGKYTETGAIGTAVGAGRANTAAIVSAQGAGMYAAKICADLNLGGCSDWFLPSKDELDLMYKNLRNKGLGGFASIRYWSSSQVGYGAAWGQGFAGGDQGYSSTGSGCRVRAVRAF
jgi:hypothetical protein